MNYSSKSVRRLIECLDASVEQGSVEEICSAVKQGMVDLMTEGDFELPAEFLRQAPDSYARHLMHKADGYAVVIMVWGPGQGTPIHDHDEKWCVECVYSGTIKVTSYDLIGDGADDETVEFREAVQVDAGKGMAGALIPPFDYHVIENATDTLAVTVHVYGGEMHGCHTFARMDDGRYQRQRSALSYTV